MLAMPKTEEQLGFLKSHLRDRGLLDHEFHIGLHKRGHSWRWSDHNELNMDSNFNDLYGEDEKDINCGVFFKGHIRGSKCSKQRPYICEIKRGKYRSKSLYTVNNVKNVANLEDIYNVPI